MSDSDGEAPPEGRRTKRPRKYRFQRFADVVNEVDVDVFREVKAVRSVPLNGAASFFQEQLEAWRELCLAPHFADAQRRLAPLCRTMPLLLHHKDEVLDVLLGCLTLEAKLSLEAVCALVGHLARDLQADFLPYVPRVADALATLVEAGADRDPEAMRAAFTCLGMVFKDLQRQLVRDIPGVLRPTQRLRYANASHVRSFAGEVAAFLLRTCPGAALAGAVRALLAEQAARPSEARTHGAAVALAEAVVGPQNGLHSRGARLLAMVLAEAGEVREGGALGVDEARARVTAVAALVLHRVLEHVRASTCGEVWDVLLQECEARAGQARDAASARHVARAVGLVAAATEHRGGSRVRDWGRLAKAVEGMAGHAGFAVGGEVTDAVDGEDYEEHDYRRYLRLTLSGQTLRLASAVVGGWSRRRRGEEGEEGAKGTWGGPGASAAAWHVLFTRPPAMEEAAFLRSLLATREGAGEAVRSMGPQMLGAAGRCWDAGVDGALPLLADLCAAMGQGALEVGRKGVPALLTAQPGGVRLSSRVRACVDAIPTALSAPQQQPTSSTAVTSDMPQSAPTAAASDQHQSALAEAWCALQCLPHAFPDRTHLASALEGPWAACRATVAAPAATEPALAVAAEVARMMAACHADDPAALQQLAEAGAAAARTYPGSVHALRMASAPLTALRVSGHPPPASVGTFDSALAAVLTHLDSPSQAVRVEALRLLSCFEAPSTSHGPCRAFASLLAVEAGPCTLEAGRRGVAALGQLKADVEFKRVPPSLAGAVARGLCGVLHVRFAVLWAPAAAALAAAVGHLGDEAWGVVARHVKEAQGAFLRGEGVAGAGTQVQALLRDHALPFSLLDRFATVVGQGSVSASGGCTDPSTRLGWLLTAMAQSPGNVLQSRAEDWGEVMVTLLEARGGGAGVGDGGEGEDGREGEGEGKDEGGEGEEGDDNDGDGDGEGDAEAGDGITIDAVDTGRQGRSLSGREWRQRAMNWLSVLSAVPSTRDNPLFLRIRAAVARLVGDRDGSVQAAALKALRPFKLRFLGPHLDRLVKMADDKTLREQLAAFPLAPSTAREGEEGLLDKHRPGLMPVLTRLLFSKMRKRTGRLGGRGAAGSARSAILNFLAAAPPHELTTLVELFLSPLAPALPREREALADAAAAEAADTPFAPFPDASSDTALVPGHWWAPALLTRPLSWWLAAFDPTPLATLPPGTHVAALHAVSDMLAHLGHRMPPFFPPLMAAVTSLLRLGASALPGTLQMPDANHSSADHPAATTVPTSIVAKHTIDSSTTTSLHADPIMDPRHLRDLRVQALRLLAAALERFPASADLSALWGPMLAAAAPMAARLGAECVATRPPAALELALALAGPELAGVLGEGQGQSVLGHALAVLGMQGASRESTGAALGVAERLMGAGSGAVRDGDAEEGVTEAQRRAMEPHAGRVLQWLAGLVGEVGRGSRGSLRELGLLEALGVTVRDEERGVGVADALVALLGRRDGRGRAMAGLPRQGQATGRAASALAAVLAGMRAAGLRAREGAGAESGRLTRARIEGYLSSLAPLLASVGHDEARTALCRCLTALAGLLGSGEAAAAQLAAVNATAGLGEPDYDARLGGYRAMDGEWWRGLPGAWVAPAVFQCLRDVRGAEDLALRQGAARAMEWLVDAGGDPGAGDALGVAVVRLAGPQLRSGLGASSLAVRQECAALLRRAALKWPGSMATVAALVDADETRCFLTNATHLQQSRRVRAFHGLAARLRAACGDVRGMGGDEEGEGNDAGDADALAPSLPKDPATLPGALLSVVVPLLEQCLLEGRAAEGGVPMKAKDVDREANVAEAAVRCLGAVALALPWAQYEPLLMRQLRLLKARRAREASKRVLRAVCAVLDSFHFLDGARDGARPDVAGAVRAALEGGEGGDGEVAGAGDGKGDATAALVGFMRPEAEQGEGVGEDMGVVEGGGGAGAEEGGGVDGGPEGGDEDGEGAEGADAVISNGVEETGGASGAVADRLRRSVLPALRAELVSGDTVRAPVAIAIAKLLRLLPRAAEAAELPPALQLACNVLRSRAQHVRDDARRALAQVCAELGPYCVPFVAQTLRYALPMRGYTAHVRGHALHAAVEAALSREAPPGCLDEAIPVLLPMLEEDLFSEETTEGRRTPQVRAQTAEAKRTRAPDTLQLLASACTFADYAGALVGVAKGRLAEAGTDPALHARVTELLGCVARGAQSSPTLTATALAGFVARTVAAGMGAEEAQRRAVEAAAGAGGRTAEAVAKDRTTDKDGRRGVAVAARAVPGARAERRVAEGGASAETEGEGVAGLAGGAHGHAFVEMALSMLVAALRRGPLSGRDAETLGLLDPLLLAMVRVLGSRHATCVVLACRALQAMAPLPLPSLPAAAKEAGAALTAAMKRCASSTEPVAQEGVALLTSLLRECADFQPSTQQLRFLLKWAFKDMEEHTERGTLMALLRAMVARQIVVPEVFDVMDRVQELMVRAQSPTVRAQCARSLLQYLLDFPLGEKRLDAHLRFLLANLAYEHHEGRREVLAMVKAVVTKFPAPALAPRAQLTFVPLAARVGGDTHPDCRAAAAECVAALLTRLPAGERDRLFGMAAAWAEARDARLRGAGAALVGVFAGAERAAFGRRASGAIPALLAPVAEAAEGGGDWRAAHQALCALERVAESVPGLAEACPEEASVAWEAAAACLAHEHAWVRKAATRVVARCLGDAVSRSQLLGAEGAAGRVALSLFVQLAEADGEDEEGCAATVRCLLGVVGELRDGVGVEGGREGGSEGEDGEGGDGSGSEGDEDGVGAGAGAGVAREGEGDGEGAYVKRGSGSGQRRLSEAGVTLHGLMRRVCRLADDGRRGKRAARMAALRFLAGACSALGPSRFAPYLPLAMVPIYRLNEGSQRVPADIKSLGEEVHSHLRAAMGVDATLSAFAGAREAVAARRAARRQRRAVEAVVDPAAAAEARRRKHGRKREAERAKMGEVKRRKAAGAPLGELARAAAKRGRKRGAEE